jgi:hypothetical protein
MTIAIKPTASGSTIEQDGSTILTVDSSGNITPSNNLYPKGPTFRAYNTTTVQSITNGSYTKALYPTEEFDTDGCYDTTNSRFTPNVAGYYQINAGNGFVSNLTGTRWILLYKNGSELLTFQRIGASGTGTFRFSGSSLAYANGTTDYFEIYLWQDSGGTLDNFTSNQTTCFSASLVSV